MTDFGITFTEVARVTRDEFGEYEKRYEALIWQPGVHPSLDWLWWHNTESRREKDERRTGLPR